VGSLDHARLAAPLIAAGLAQLGAGDPRRASATLREALALCKTGERSLQTIDARFGLARALWATGNGRAEALMLAAAARDDSLALPRPTVRDRAVRKEIVAWCSDPRHVVALPAAKPVAQADPSASGTTETAGADDVAAPP
jgi:hypothetical protein